jgi:hypothetical protein
MQCKHNKAYQTTCTNAWPDYQPIISAILRFDVAGDLRTTNLSACGPVKSETRRDTVMICVEATSAHRRLHSADTMLPHKHKQLISPSGPATCHLKASILCYQLNFSTTRRAAAGAHTGKHRCGSSLSAWQWPELQACAGPTVGSGSCHDLTRQLLRANEVTKSNNTSPAERQNPMSIGDSRWVPSLNDQHIVLTAQYAC